MKNPEQRKAESNRIKHDPSLEASLDGIRHLLSHLHGEVSHLEAGYDQVLRVLQKLEVSADMDDLTGLLRRKAFFKKWDDLLSECRRLEEVCGVVLIDIDHFKKVNDTHGHPAGDAVIQRLAGILREFESPRCFAARLGGEEFAVAFRAGTAAAGRDLAETLRVRARDAGGPVSFTVSAGVSTRAPGGNNGEHACMSELLSDADAALYAAKRGGRDRVEVATPGARKAG